MITRRFIVNQLNKQRFYDKFKQLLIVIKKNILNEQMIQSTILIIYLIIIDRFMLFEYEQSKILIKKKVKACESI